MIPIFFRYAQLMVVCGLLCSPPAMAGYTRINKDNPNDPMAAHIYRLDNGLTVYLTENHEKPRIYTEISVRAGSKNDPSNNTGMAHYQEHLMSKGNHRLATIDFEKEKPHLDRIVELYEAHFKETDPEKRKTIYAEINKESQLASRYSIPREHDKLWKAMGGSGRNAHTWVEETVYKVDIPANRLRQWVVLESERFVDPVFRMFQTELEVVYEEKNRSLDDKRRLLFDAVNKILYKNHPYGQQTTIGTVDHLKNPSLKTMYEFYRKNYVPGNMAIALSGDFKIPEAIGLIDAHFLGWKAKDVPEQRKWSEEPLSGVERVTVKYKGEERVLLAFRTAHRNHEDADALTLIDMTLDNATAGLINLNLNQKQKVRRAGSNPYLHNDYGAQILWGIPKKGQTLEEVEQLLLGQLSLIKKGEFEDWILPAIVTDFKKTQKSRFESNTGRVRFMSNAFIGYKDWEATIGEIGRMEKVTKADVVRVANKYFGDDYGAGYRVDEQQDIPKIEKPVIDQIKIDPSRQSAYAKKLLDMQVQEIEPVYVDPETDYKITDYSEGVKLYYSQNPINDLFSLTITFEIGNNQDNRMGLATRLLDKSGAEEVGASTLKKEWYKLGTDFSISAGGNETNITISGLDENFDQSLGLMMDLLKKPSADQATLDELVKIILGQREDAKKDHRQIRGAVIIFNRHGSESRYLRMLTNDEVKALTVSELHGAIQGLLGYKHTISYTGSLPLDSVMAALGERHKVAGDLKDPPPYKFLELRKPEENEVYFFQKEMAQSQVFIEFGCKAFDENLIPPAEFYNVYFAGGFGGVVLQELREARGLAYSAGAGYYAGTRKGEQDRLWAGLGCQVDKTPEALEAFIDIIDNLPASGDRFEESQKSLINQYRTSKIGFRQVLGQVRSWEKLGLSGDPKKTRFQRHQAASLDTLVQFHATHLKGRPKLISIVGDSTRIDIQRLGKVGKIRKVGLEDVFVF